MLRHPTHAAVIGGRAQRANTPSRGRLPVFAGVLALASLAGCVTAEPYNPSQLAPDQLARVGEICQIVLVVQPGEQHFDVCVERLSDSLTSARQVDPAAGSFDRASGLAAGATSVSYFYASSAELRRREQLSCARLGLDPASQDFAICVARLAGTLQAFDTPPT